MTSLEQSSLDLWISEDLATVGYERALGALVTDRVASRIFAKDATLWQNPAAASARLGWTAFEARAGETTDEIIALRTQLQAAGIDRVLLCGMGGSSLAPAVISKWAGVSLEVLDSTHPDAVRRAVASDLGRTVVVISSKSGSTIETLSHREVFTEAMRAAGLDPAVHIVVITDPGSPLEAAAQAAGQRVFSADPEVGGRFSALTAFGIVPAGLAGADPAPLIADAMHARESLMSDSPDNPALRLAAALFAGLPGAFVLGIVSDAQWGLGAWIEQLVAESTGKQGLGVLPIALPAGAPEEIARPDNTLIVHLRDAVDSASRAHLSELQAPGVFTVAGDLGAQFLMWEVATAALGRLLGIDPFDQPDVEAAKVAAREVLSVPTHRTSESYEIAGAPGARLLALPGTGESYAAAGIDGIVDMLSTCVPKNGYLAIQAYLDPEGSQGTMLHELRDRLARRLGVPVALGWGPRYLHSVGQLHKGGPVLGAFLQLCESSVEGLEIPGSENGFDQLIVAQARGDRRVLIARGRPVVAVTCDDPDQTIKELVAAL